MKSGGGLMKSMCGVCRIVGAILVVGGLSWGMVAIFGSDPVSRVFGPMTMVTRIIYGVIGIAGVLMFFSFFKVCSACQAKMQKG